MAASGFPRRQVAARFRSCQQRGAFMFRVIAGLVVCVGMSATAAAQDAKVVAHGEKVYVDQKCAVCHSIGGKGNQKGPLDGVASKLKPEELREWIVDAKGMT